VEEVDVGARGARAGQRCAPNSRIALSAACQQERGEQQPRQSARAAAATRPWRCVRVREVDVVGEVRRHRVVQHLRATRGLDDETMVRVEHDLVAGPQDRIAHGFAVDDAGVGVRQAAQDRLALVGLDARVAFGERRIVDADVGLVASTDDARMIEREAASVVTTAHAAQQDARIAAVLAVGRGHRLAGTRGAEQDQLRAPRYRWRRPRAASPCASPGGR
jgi:hypothetical protein